MEGICDNQLFLKPGFAILYQNDVTIFPCIQTLEFTFEIRLYNEEIGTNMEAVIIMLADFNIAYDMSIIMLVIRINVTQ